MKSEKNYKKVATIDLGSNGIRMLISNLYKIKGKYFHTKNTLHRVPIRLGQDAFTSGKISVKNEKKLLSALSAFKNLMDANEIIDYLGYATSAMRTCSNGNKILKKIKKDIGLEIKIISGKKESNVVSGNDISEHIGKSPNYCFIDVGGGSTEVIVYKDFKFFKSKSFKIGGVRLINGLVNEEVWEEFGKWLKNNAIELRKVKVVGIGGNINKIFKISKNKVGTPLSIKKFKKTLDKLESLSEKKLLINYKLNPDRADVIVPAGKIYFFLMKTLGIEKIYVPKIGLVDGMVKEIIKL